MLKSVVVTVICEVWGCYGPVRLQTPLVTLLLLLAMGLPSVLLPVTSLSSCSFPTSVSASPGIELFFLFCSPPLSYSVVMRQIKTKFGQSSALPQGQ